MEAAISLTEIKDSKLAKKTDGRKTRNIRGIPKYMGANFAGSTNQKDVLWLWCEGDSAKAGIVSGLSKEDRNTYGVFPLKGKLMNTLMKTKIKLIKMLKLQILKRLLDLFQIKFTIVNLLRKH